MRTNPIKISQSGGIHTLYLVKALQQFSGQVAIEHPMYVISKIALRIKSFIS